jgi:hypothetical protein
MMEAPETRSHNPSLSQGRAYKSLRANATTGLRATASQADDHHARSSLQVQRRYSPESPKACVKVRAGSQDSEWLKVLAVPR